MSLLRALFLWLWAVAAFAAPPSITKTSGVSPGGAAGGDLTGTYPSPTLADAELQALRDLIVAANKCIVWTGTGAVSTFDCVAFGRSALSYADASAWRTGLGLVPGTDVQAYDATLAALAAGSTGADVLHYWSGTDTLATTTLTSAARSVLDDTSTGAMLTTLGAQASDAELAALAGLTSAADKLPYFTGAGTAAVTDLTTSARDLLDDASVAAQRATLNPTSLGSTDNAVLRKDGASDDRLAQGSSVTIDDNGVLTTPATGGMKLTAASGFGTAAGLFSFVNLATDSSFAMGQGSEARYGILWDRVAYTDIAATTTGTVATLDPTEDRLIVVYAMFDFDRDSNSDHTTQWKYTVFEQTAGGACTRVANPASMAGGVGGPTFDVNCDTTPSPDNIVLTCTAPATDGDCSVMYWVFESNIPT